MKHRDTTSIGGPQSRFQTTHWSVIQAAKTDEPTRRRTMIGNLTATYWKPVYCYLKRRGYDNETAKDLTQGFFCEIVLRRELIRKADREKGRFRTFLLTALECYVASVHRGRMRRKAAPAGGFVELADEELANLQVPEAAHTPEQAFDLQWAADLLNLVMAELREEYHSTGRAPYWELFRLKVLGPILDNATPPALEEICPELGIESESKASNMLVTVKRRFRSVLLRRLRDLAGSDAEARGELNDLFAILSRAGAS